MKNITHKKLTKIIKKIGCEIEWSDDCYILTKQGFAVTAIKSDFGTSVHVSFGTFSMNFLAKDGILKQQVISELRRMFVYLADYKQRFDDDAAGLVYRDCVVIKSADHFLEEIYSEE